MARLLRRSRTSNTEDDQLEKVARLGLEIASYGAALLATWARGRQPNRPSSNDPHSPTAPAGMPTAGGTPIPWGIKVEIPAKSSVAARAAGASMHPEGLARSHLTGLRF